MRALLLAAIGSAYASVPWEMPSAIVDTILVQESTDTLYLKLGFSAGPALQVLSQGQYRMEGDPLHTILLPATQIADTALLELPNWIHYSHVRNHLGSSYLQLEIPSDGPLPITVAKDGSGLTIKVPSTMLIRPTLWHNKFLWIGVVSALGIGTGVILWLNEDKYPEVNQRIPDPEVRLPE